MITFGSFIVFSQLMMTKLPNEFSHIFIIYAWVQRVAFFGFQIFTVFLQLQFLFLFDQSLSLSSLSFLSLLFQFHRLFLPFYFTFKCFLLSKEGKKPFLISLKIYDYRIADSLQKIQLSIQIILFTCFIFLFYLFKFLLRHYFSFKLFFELSNIQWLILIKSLSFFFSFSSIPFRVILFSNSPFILESLTQTSISTSSQ